MAPSSSRPIATCLRRFDGSRTAPRVGDLFVGRPPDGAGPLYGRVVKIDADAGMGGRIAKLLYVYDVRGREGEQPPWERFDPHRLLVPPLLTNTTPWTSGLFRTIDNRPLGAGDVLERHVFRDDLRNRCVDDEGAVVVDAQPLRDWGLGSYRSTDDKIADALGLPRAPD